MQNERILRFLRNNVQGVRIVIGETKKGVAGCYDSKKKLITISPDSKDNIKVLAHEIAHAVAIEKWNDATHRKFGLLGLYMGIDLFTYDKGHKTARALKLKVKQK